MEKELTKKEVITASVNNSDYKALRDLTNEDLKFLPMVKVALKKSSYNGNESYSWEYKYGPLPLGSKRLDAVAYLSILNIANLEPTGSVTNVPARMRGVITHGKDGKDHKQLQFIFGYRTFLTRLINDSELRLMEAYVKQGKQQAIKWVNKPEEIDSVEEVNIKANDD